MPRLRSHHLIAALLALVSAAVAAWAIVAQQRHPGENLALLLMLAVALAQVALAAAWVAWGRRIPVVRLAAAVGVIVGWAPRLLAWNREDATSGQWMFVLGCYAALIVGVLAALRAGGLGVSVATDGEQHDAAVERTWRLGQFSLWDVLSTVTAAALLAGFWRWLQVPWQSLFSATAFVAAFGLLAVVSLLAGLACRRPSRLILIGFFAILFTLSGLQAFGATRNYLPVLAVLFGYIALALQALRAAGLRLAKVDRHHAPAPRTTCDQSEPTRRVA